jgi:hypothetical protein
VVYRPPDSQAINVFLAGRGHQKSNGAETLVDTCGRLLWLCLAQQGDRLALVSFATRTSGSRLFRRSACANGVGERDHTAGSLDVGDVDVFAFE